MARHIAPGYCVVKRPGTLDYQARELLMDSRSPATHLFMTPVDIFVDYTGK
ncbi:hypothetical protein ABW286_10730 [Erwinia papayae]|uniref:Uncharacterized protein n=1 Tax=Erwinia papayae TaxID=206499 RepID=A0ABV3N1F9_9GAMM